MDKQKSKAQIDTTIADYAKMGTFLMLDKDGAKSTLKGHKSHLGWTRRAADRAVNPLHHHNLKYGKSNRGLLRRV